MNNAARVVIVDDDKDEASLIQDELQYVNVKSSIYSGPFPNIDHVITYLVSNFDAAILDHRLFRIHASFDGATLAARLYDRAFPAVLITTFFEPYVKDAIRLHRRKVPVLLARSESSPDVLRESLVKCKAEIDGVLAADRKPYRVIVQVEELMSNGDLVVQVPTWREKEAVIIPKALLNVSSRDKVRAGTRLLAMVNIGARVSDDLFFDAVELAPAPDPLDGFATRS